jgi:hypothetical protein
MIPNKPEIDKRPLSRYLQPPLDENDIPIRAAISRIDCPLTSDHLLILINPIKT